MADWIMVGANSAQDFWTEQAPDPCGTCCESGAGLTGGIWPLAASAKSSRLWTVVTNWMVLCTGWAPSLEFPRTDYKGGV